MNHYTNRIGYLILQMICLSLFLTFVAQAQEVVVLRPVADTTIRSHANTNVVSGDSIHLYFTVKPSRAYRPMMRFDLSSIDLEYRIIDARLKVLFDSDTLSYMNKPPVYQSFMLYGLKDGTPSIDRTIPPNGSFDDSEDVYGEDWNELLTCSTRMAGFACDETDQYGYVINTNVWTHIGDSAFGFGTKRGDYLEIGDTSNSKALCRFLNDRQHDNFATILVDVSTHNGDWYTFRSRTYTSPLLELTVAPVKSTLIMIR